MPFFAELPTFQAHGHCQRTRPAAYNMQIHAIESRWIVCASVHSSVKENFKYPADPHERH
jgi:hypothetical protein